MKVPGPLPAKRDRSEIASEPRKRQEERRPVLPRRRDDQPLFFSRLSCSLCFYFFTSFSSATKSATWLPEHLPQRDYPQRPADLHSFTVRPDPAPVTLVQRPPPVLAPAALVQRLPSDHAPAALVQRPPPDHAPAALVQRPPPNPIAWPLHYHWVRHRGRPPEWPCKDPGAWRPGRPPDPLSQAPHLGWPGWPPD
ncbi:uncharacterized protein LOC133474526 [Phyllopteryx taeniolatus]|uniref:uncharacterized protein LOC133474526 n=1 Tax=Phyllopteryx taeniolatus TaxID=161469 RepID=UPI002AD458FC|nr:uncharacterized protein LOC133474526 [Phyllopteryx taeniolatus]